MTARYRDWQRHYPTARRIAALLSADLLRLRTATLAADVRDRFGVSPATAFAAVGMARRALVPASRARTGAAA